MLAWGHTRLQQRGLTLVVVFQQQWPLRGRNSRRHIFWLDAEITIRDFRHAFDSWWSQPPTRDAPTLMQEATRGRIAVSKLMGYRPVPRICVLNNASS